MVSKYAWSLVLIPVFALLWFGIAGISNIDLPLAFYKPSGFFGLMFLFAGGVGAYSLFFHYTMRASTHGKHCIKTSFLELFIVGALIVSVVGHLTGTFAFNGIIDVIVLLFLAGITGIIGMILYGLDKK